LAAALLRLELSYLIIITIENQNHFVTSVLMEEFILALSDEESK